MDYNSIRCGRNYMSNSIKLALLTILITAAFFGGVYFTRPAPCGASCEKQLQTVDVTQFSELANESGATVIDVRTPEEYSSGHITNAVNSDFSNQAQFEQYLNSLDKNARYLIYCRSGNRSGQALKLMEEKGFTHVSNLSGGIIAWQSANMIMSK